MGTYDNPLQVGVDTVSQGGVALLHVAIGTRGGVGRDRCPDGGQVSRKKTGCVSALQQQPVVEGEGGHRRALLLCSCRVADRLDDLYLLQTPQKAGVCNPQQLRL